MTTQLHDPPVNSPPESADDLSDRMLRLEGEVAELRSTLSELAEIVVNDIRDRREAGLSGSATTIPDVPAPPVGEGTIPPDTVRRPWLLFDFLREIGLTFRMYMDARYRVRRGTQLMVPLILGLVVANYLFFNQLMVQVPVFTPIIERLITIVLAVLLYKVLSREVARYRRLLAAIGATPRSWRSVPVSVLTADPDTAAVTRQESP
jgi:hypothetical protein